MTHRRQNMAARARRLRRTIGFDHNELRRRPDRIQRTAGVSLFVGYLALASVTSGLIAQRVYDYGVRSGEDRARTSHRISTSVVRGDGSSADSRTVQKYRRVDAAFAGLLGAGLTGMPPLATYLLLRRRCDRQRDRLWDEGRAELDHRHIG